MFDHPTTALPLLTTKLHVPPCRPQRVPRPRLVTQLNCAFSRPATLIVASAGYGKSTLICEWMARVDRPYGWLSLDEDDNDLTRFFTYLIAALRTCQPGLGETALTLLAAPQSPSAKAILTLLLNDLGALDSPIALVLDDYHLVATPAIHDAMTFLVEHLPHQAHLVLISRADPPLPLARWRARSYLNEVRTDDLRFTEEEAAAFLNQVMELELSAADVAALEQRTEGWITGLQLAALSLRGQRNASEFVHSFSGSHRYILDYLTEEVLRRQPEPMQQFLLQTSLPDRLTASLCDAITGQEESQNRLIELEQANLFLVPLDDERRWYRYHHLFGDLLRNRLRKLHPEQIPELHRRAAGWFEQSGLIGEALDHALAAHDHDQAVQWIEANVLRFTLSNETSSLSRWLRALPPGLSQTRPLLAFAQAGIALLGSQFAQTKQWVETAEHALAASSPATTAPFDPKTFQGYLDALRSTAMINLHDPVEEIIAIAQRALGNLPADEGTVRGVLALSLGDAYLRQQKYELAANALAEAVALSGQANNPTVHLVALGGQGEVYAQQGNLSQAATIFQLAIERGQRWGGTSGQSHPATGKAHALYAQLLYEWDQLTAAEQQAEAAVECCKQWGHTKHLMDGYLALANSLAAQGKIEQAHHTLSAARSVAAESWRNAQEQRTQMNAAHRLAAMVDHAQLELWLREGRLQDGARWLAGPSPNGEATISLARARLALAQHDPDGAAHWLAHHQKQSASQPTLAGQLKFLLLQAQVHWRQGDLAEALAALRTALHLAEPGRYVRTFVDEGSAVAELLQMLVQQMGATEYTQRLLAAFHSQPGGSAATSPQRDHLESGPLIMAGPGRFSNARSPSPSDLEGRLVEPLSERELEVLALVAAGHSNREIGAQLFIEVGTVKRHITNIFGKLGATSRTQAIAVARQLGLLP
jgi:LuxR family transcriptional regulator, maltose regulon positive regulatory protein